MEPGATARHPSGRVGDDPALHGSEADERLPGGGTAAADAGALDGRRYAVASIAWWASRPQYLELGSAAFGQRRPLDMTAAQRPPASSSS